MVEIVEARILQERGPHGAHIVDEPGDRSSVGEYALECPRQLGLVREVRFDEEVHGILGRDAVEHDDAEAVRTQPRGGGPADSPGAARNEDVVAHGAGPLLGGRRTPIQPPPGYRSPR